MNLKVKPCIDRVIYLTRKVTKTVILLGTKLIIMMKETLATSLLTNKESTIYLLRMRL